MAGADTIRVLADAFQVAGPVGQGLVNRETANYNAGLLDQQGKVAAQNAAFNESRIRRSNAQTIARQVADVGATGLTFSGSIQDVVRQNAGNLELDALAERYRGQIETAGYRSKAKMTRLEGDQALYEGVTSAGMKLLDNYRTRKPYLTVG